MTDLLLLDTPSRLAPASVTDFQTGFRFALVLEDGEPLGPCPV
jgi:hypothetical protein